MKPRDAILRALQHADAMLSTEIAEQTGLPWVDVVRELAAMLRVDLVRQTGNRWACTFYGWSRPRPAAEELTPRPKGATVRP